MNSEYHRYKYVIWEVDDDQLFNLKTNTSFNEDLMRSFDFASKNIKPPQVNGNAYSTMANEPIKYKDFESFLNLLMPKLRNNLYKLWNKDIKKSIATKCWANRMHKDSSGKIHKHNSIGNDKIKVFSLIFYYNVPLINSADLVFLNPKKYSNSFEDIDIETIEENDKLHFKVLEGMCILHDGDIPHAVSIHKNESPRDAIILDFFFET